ncbi:Sec-independent protein translocase protein TatB [Novosphingobium sp. ZN18A2]|uniref:Sec-independent protein translocase protein TatB n=1 Tax=Novosphingobium sp. ZN18A2 TaxID=3079861 RepID=UPI0030D0E041
MFDIGASELLLIVIVAVVVIGPKDLPLAMRTAGRWIGQIRRVSNHFRSGIEAMIREAELEEMEKKWQEHNAAIMAQDITVEDKANAASADAAAPAMEPLTAAGSDAAEPQGAAPPSTEHAPASDEAPAPAAPAAAADAKPEGPAS